MTGKRQGHWDSPDASRKRVNSKVSMSSSNEGNNWYRNRSEGDSIPPENLARRGSPLPSQAAQYESFRRSEPSRSRQNSVWGSSSAQGQRASPAPQTATAAACPPRHSAPGGENLDLNLVAQAEESLPAASSSTGPQSRGGQGTTTNKQFNKERPRHPSSHQPTTSFPSSYDSNVNMHSGAELSQSSHSASSAVPPANVSGTPVQTGDDLSEFEIQKAQTPSEHKTPSSGSDRESGPSRRPTSPEMSDNDSEEESEEERLRTLSESCKDDKSKNDIPNWLIPKRPPKLPKDGIHSRTPRNARRDAWLWLGKERARRLVAVNKLYQKWKPIATELDLPHHDQVHTNIVNARDYMRKHDLLTDAKILEYFMMFGLAD